MNRDGRHQPVGGGREEGAGAERRAGRGHVQRAVFEAGKGHREGVCVCVHACGWLGGWVVWCVGVWVRANEFFLDGRRGGGGG